MGKSTLAAYLANDLKIFSTFPDAVLWTSFGQFQTSDEANLEIKNRLKSWGELLGNSNIHRIVRLDDIADQLAIMLKNRKVLLLCDDVWDIDHISKVRRLVDGDIYLVVTTRFTAIANTIPTYQDGVYELKVFSEKDAVRLLEIIAPKVVKQYPRESMELVLDLECLPLAIHIAGLMLRKEMQAGLEVKELLQELREEGERLLHEPPPLDMIELIKEAPSPTVAAWLKRSTKLLDSQTRACFVSLGLLASKPATFGRHLSEADKAFACYQKAEVIAEEEKEEDALWRARGNQGLILSDQNCHSESIKLQTEVLNHYQSKNNHRFIGHAHFNLAYSLYRKGDIEMAKIQGAEALRLLVMINDSYVKEVQRQMNTWE